MLLITSQARIEAFFGIFTSSNFFSHILLSFHQCQVLFLDPFCVDFTFLDWLFRKMFIDLNPFIFVVLIKSDRLGFFWFLLFLLNFVFSFVLFNVFFLIQFILHVSHISFATTLFSRAIMSAGPTSSIMCMSFRYAFNRPFFIVLLFLFLSSFLNVFIHVGYSLSCLCFLNFSFFCFFSLLVG